ncbi:hypothetical protein A7D35_02880 [Xanthomonas arboricola]|uniref:hypothetical protein n=1 Tax=Xanthomonas arboricola TaxID=56448 RepID=UPI0007EDD448|nr:hypothetical protein [Xanthomonas arboricola]OBR78775.1 hypothetical protein A7D35_02880 [Xanthomonas arboricola]
MNTAVTESIRLPEIIAMMLNYAGVADSCEITQGHAPVAIRNWAEMLQQSAAPAAVPVVPPGWVLVPKQFGIPANAWDAAAFAFGGPSTGEGEPFLDCTAWIGETVGDEGEKTYGLHISCDECPEEGSITLAEFATHPEPAATTGVPELFVQWLEREMPPGTIIGKPAWWAPKLARALRSAERGVLGGCNG